MLSKSSKKRLKDRKVLKHSNPAQFLKRIRDQAKTGIKDLTFLASILEEDQLEEIFTEKETERLVGAILKPRNMRTIILTEAIMCQAYQKLMSELPVEIVNSQAPDISKTYFYAKMLATYANKPMKREQFFKKTKRT